MLSDQQCGSSLFVGLPEDALTVVNQFLSPKDVCNLGSCCRTLYGVASSDAIWISHCEKIGILLQKDLVEWRKGFASYKALFHFLSSVHPLLGIWVHQEPELGNVVYVMPGFVSVVGCRIIPQKLGPLGLEGGPIRWTPVFEIIADFDGSAVLFLHGREGDDDHLYPGSFKPGGRTCNMLSLEVEARPQSNDLTEPSVPFSRLAFDNRRKLLESVTCKIRFKAPALESGLFFPCLRNDEEKFRQDIVLLCERRSLLIHSYKQGGDFSDYRSILESLNSGFCKYFGLHDNMFEVSVIENRHAQLHEFLRSCGDALGLTLKASTMEFTCYRSWPYRSLDDRVALYKMPVQGPTIDHEYAGLWGASFGWRPTRRSDREKALYFLWLSCTESQGQRFLAATKILEGNEYICHPNGSVMFSVNIDEVSLEPFPWDTTDVLHAFPGQGIRKRDGFRCPKNHPGSLYVIRDGLLAFVWEEPIQSVMTLQRLDLPELLSKGQLIPPSSPVWNFSYLGVSYGDLFHDFTNT